MTRISIIEDQEAIRNGLAAVFNDTQDLRMVGLHPNAVEGLNVISDKECDLVILDIGLPDLSGIECARRLKEKYPRLPVMMFTVHEHDDQVFEALKAGADSYILKTAGPDKVVEAVRDLLAGGSPMSNHIARKVVSFFHKEQSRENHELSEREMDVLKLLSDGHSYKEIAGKLFIATGTVKRHIHRIYEKLHVTNRTQAVNKVFLKS